MVLNEIVLFSKSYHVRKNKCSGNSTYDAACINILEKVGGKVDARIAYRKGEDKKQKAHFAVTGW